ncbi:site-specific integrase [Aeromonas popoffii]|uniref:hypothetical protein n=1 Tax=Aeromonas popoffii TaxID=70856 RepID=UPI000AC648B7|nr:hypothetical protein [Aeromonas popoffii]
MKHEILYNSNVNAQDEKSKPDGLYYIGVEPKDEFVVSRDSDGGILSYYFDDVWNWSSYNNGKNAAFNFYVKSNKETLFSLCLKKEMKWIFFSLIWMNKGPILSFRTLSSYLSLLRVLGLYLVDKKLTYKKFFSNNKYIDGFSNSINQGRMSKLGMLIRHCHSLFNIDVMRSDKEGILLSINKKKNEYISGLCQHPPIPSRIYSNVIKFVKDDLDDISSSIDKIIELSHRCIEDPILGLGRGGIKKKRARGEIVYWNKGKVSFLELLEEYSLVSFFNRHNLRKDRQGLSFACSFIQKCAAVAIQIFSGMRISEVDSLPYGCIKEHILNGKVHYLIEGFTTKFNHGIKLKAKWVTNNDGVTSIYLARKISDLIYSVSHMRVPDEDRVLFASITQLPFSPGMKQEVSAITSIKINKYVSEKTLEVINSDIDELKIIEPFRNWDNDEKIKVGEKWPFTSHQARRSLALYASHSGLVSLPSLKLQLKHITTEMTLYYAKGSELAVNIINPKSDHFANEYQKSQHFSQAQSYLNVIFDENSKLAGVHGLIVNRQSSSEHTVIFNDRVETVKKFQKGELSYRETFLGGCTLIGECDKRITNPFTECLDCASAIIKREKLDKIIADQTNLIKMLDEGSFEWKKETKELNYLLGFKDKCNWGAE